jgi:hypothetical protein
MESTLPESRPPYLRRQLPDLFRSGRSPEELAKEYEPTATTIRNRLARVKMVRPAARSHGVRIRKCSADCFHRAAREDLTPELPEIPGPAVDHNEVGTQVIRRYEERSFA